jgi:hypothetical protein
MLGRMAARGEEITINLAMGGRNFEVILPPMPHACDGHSTPPASCVGYACRCCTHGRCFGGGRLLLWWLWWLCTVVVRTDGAFALVALVALHRRTRTVATRSLRFEAASSPSRSAGHASRWRHRLMVAACQLTHSLPPAVTPCAGRSCSSAAISTRGTSGRCVDRASCSPSAPVFP